MSPIVDDFGDGIIGASIVARDISGRKHADVLSQNRSDELEGHVRAHAAEIEATRSRLSHALEEAQTSNRAKGAFLANMSHEIRTALPPSFVAL